MSDSTLAMNIGKNIEEAHHLREVFLGAFKEVSQMIEDKVNFCKRTGYIDSVLGDKIKGDIERASRTGINYVCQNSASVILGAGFYNIAKNARRLGYQCGAESYIHDSITNLIDVKDLLKMDLLYSKYFRKWCKQKFGIDYKYDLDLGVNFKDKFHYKFDLKEMTVELDGKVQDVNYVIKYLEPEYGIKEYIPILDKKGEVEDEYYTEGFDNDPTAKNIMDNWLNFTHWRQHLYIDDKEFDNRECRHVKFKIDHINDIDWYYEDDIEQIPYFFDELAKHKAMLKSKGIQIIPGVDVE
jgi:hypothetical protein